MSKMEEIIVANGFKVIREMCKLEVVEDFDEYDRVNDELSRRIAIWRGSILCRITQEDKE